MKPRFDPRVFLALNLSRTSQQRLVSVQDELRKYLVNWHFIPQENFHVTLRFIGEVPQQTVSKIIDASHGIAKRSNSFILHWDKLEFFGTPRTARVMFVAPQDSDELNKLSETIMQVFPEEKVDPRPFHAHITLAKARQNTDPRTQRLNTNMLQRLREHGRIGPDPIEVDLKTLHREFVLMQTDWVGRSVDYEIIERFKLRDDQSLF